MNERASGPTSISVVGAGTVGSHLIEAFGIAGHEVRLAARDPHSSKARQVAERFGVDVVDLSAAADGADIIVLAVPFTGVVDAVAAIGDVGPAVLVDATNALGQDLPDGAGSVVDLIAATNPSATIVKAFNTIGAEAYTAPVIGDRALFLPMAGDERGTSIVAPVASTLGFDALIVGDRAAVRLVESFAALWIHLAFSVGLGRDFGFALLHRAAEAGAP